MVDNRQAKILSFNDKYNKNDVTSDRHFNNADLLADSEINRKYIPGSSQFRSRHFDKKQTPKQVDLVTGSKLGDRPTKINKGSYVQNSSKPFQH